MKVVFDTNIFISAFIVPGSQGERVCAQAGQRSITQARVRQSKPIRQSRISTRTVSRPVMSNLRLTRR